MRHLLDQFAYVYNMGWRSRGHFFAKIKGWRRLRTRLRGLAHLVLPNPSRQQKDGGRYDIAVNPWVHLRQRTPALSTSRWPRGYQRWCQVQRSETSLHRQPWALCSRKVYFSIAPREGWIIRLQYSVGFPSVVSKKSMVVSLQDDM